jgi:hypothetical protein
MSTCCNVHVPQPAPLQNEAGYGAYHRRFRPAHVGKRYSSGCCIQDTRPAAIREGRPRFVPNAARLLSRRRALTVEMIHKISETWKIPADLLVRPYRVESAA